MRSGSESGVTQLNEVLIWYGQWLFSEGKPYYLYAETINVFSLECPSARRQLQSAWDAAMSWHTHHTALPWQLLLAIMAIAYVWGWDDVAGILSTSISPLAKEGEVPVLYSIPAHMHS